MPLQEAFAERRGNKIKQVFIRIGALLTVFLIVLSLFSFQTVDAEAWSTGGKRYMSIDEEITYNGETMTLKEALEKVNTKNDLKAIMKEMYAPVYLDEYVDNEKIMNNLSDIVVDEIGSKWDKGWLVNHINIVNATIYNISDAIVDAWFSDFDDMFPNFLNAACERGFISPSDFKEYLDYYTMYEIISGEAGFTMPNVNVESSESIKEATEYILEKGAENCWFIESGTTLREIEEDTDKAFKAIMVGSVASSYAGALNSITSATEDAKDTLEKSLSGKYQTRSTDQVFAGEEVYETRTEDQINVDLYDIFSGVSSLVIVPVAGVILAFVFVFQLYDGINENNNMHGTDAWWFINLLIKMAIMILVVIFAWQLTEFVFNMGSWIVDQTEAAAVANELNGGTMLSTIKEYCENNGVDQDTALKWVLAYMIDLDETIDFGGTLIMLIQGLIINIGMFVISIIIWIIVYVRLIEMYIHCCIAPIPLATLMNRSWNQTGMNFIRSVVALAFQAFIIFLAIAIFNVLVSTTIESALFESNGIISAMWQTIGYGLVLIFCLFKSGSLSRSILSAR